jgi:hypothetical protein
MKLPNWIIGLVFLALVLSSLGMTTHQEEPFSSANVEQIKGKYVFVMSTPTMEYEEVGRVNTALSDLADMDKDIGQQMKEMVKKGIKKVESGKISAFDGVITKVGKVGILIKFK